jgi:hypothetical protein
MAGRALGPSKLSPGGTAVNSQGRKPLEVEIETDVSPGGAIPGACRPSGASVSIRIPVLGLTPWAIDCRRFAANLVRSNLFWLIPSRGRSASG